MQSNAAVPLCVDLDGTLVHTDTLVETALLLLRKNPAYLFALLMWLLKGKAYLKQQIAIRTNLDVSLLPYNRTLVEWLESEKANRPLVLVTAANETIAQAIAGHLQLFTTVMASNAGHNLSAANKRDALDEAFGQGQYDYVGNSRDDLAVWAHARRAVVVGGDRSLAGKAAQATELEREIPGNGSVVSGLLAAMRPHQWSKNLLVFVNILMAHQITDFDLLWSTAIAFAAFCLCSSSVYLINDLLDLEADRGHTDKHMRPFASGKVPLILGIVTAPILLAGALALAVMAGGDFLATLVLYFLVTLAYSFYIKRYVIADVLVLAILYTLRVIAGAAVAGVTPSFWLMSFSMFIFTSLAMVKRYAELKAMEHSPYAAVAGRGYHVSDLNLIAQLGVASGYIATLVLALYIDSPDVIELYEDEATIWLLCPLLMYWVGRIWLLASRGQLHQDPVVFATRDRTSYIVLLLGLVIMLVAL